ncbi:MAG: hydrogenase formation protein HypD [Thermoprotei archaeon]|nr:MAG: hydrogenase formation protein HypD [Thermoprotei archaeon]
MKELELYRDYKFAEKVKKLIWRYANVLRSRGLKVIKLMNFCGTHEWTTVHYGLRSLMPEGVELVAGPGCPVCITPSLCVEHAIKLSLEGVTVYTFGDAYRLPATREVAGARSLREARAMGGSVKVVYSFMDAVKDSKTQGGEAVFLAIGFETTAPGYAIPLARGLVPRNLKLLPALRLTPPAARHAILAAVERGLEPVRGIIAPGHVSTVTGAEPWDKLSRELGLPSVISGFEPLDLMLSVAMLLRMLYQKRVGVEIEYRRLVTWKGNTLAKRFISEVFQVSDAAWRGLGVIPDSGLELRGPYTSYDAYREYGLKLPDGKEDMPSGCRCADVIMGLARPVECPLFMKACTPSKPYGPCMVSSEGTCAIWARFGGGGLAKRVAEEVGL